MPEPPDPIDTAAAQTGTNVTTATANAYLTNPNIKGPTGSTTNRQIGTKKIFDPTTKKTYDIPLFEQETKLSSGEQGIYNTNVKNRQALGNLAGTGIKNAQNVLGTKYDYSNIAAGGSAGDLTAPSYDMFGGTPTLTDSYEGSSDFEGARTSYEDALNSRSQANWDADLERKKNELINEGLRPGTPAYNRAMDEVTRSVTDARVANRLASEDITRSRVAAARDAAAFGNTAKQQTFDNTFRVTDANNQLDDRQLNADVTMLNAKDADRSQAIAEQDSIRNRPISEIMALMGGSGANLPQAPGYNASPLPTVDVAGLIQQDYANRMGQAQAEQQASNDIWGGIGTGIGSIFKLSDERAKKDMDKVGETDDGLSIYEYSYKPGHGHDARRKHVGLKAQEVARKKPNAVARGRDGLLRVNYREALA